MENRQIGAMNRYWIAQRECASVDCVHSGNRDPQFADALLRHQVIVIIAHDPALIDVLYSNTNPALKTGPQGLKRVEKICWRLAAAE